MKTSRASATAVASVREGEPARGDSGARRPRTHAGDRLACAQGRDPTIVDVDPGDREAGLGGGTRERQPDVALAEHGDSRRPRKDLAPERSGSVHENSGR